MAFSLVLCQTSLKVKHLNVLESINAVDTAHQTGVLERMQLCQAIDYEQLVHSHGWHDADKHSEDYEDEDI